MISRRVKHVVESDADLEPNSYSLQKFRLYETQARFYLVGRDQKRLRWRVLKIDRLEYKKLNIYEDPAIYTQQDCEELLYRLAKGNEVNGGLNFVTKAYGIVGFIQFLEPYYMILVTKRRMVGKICGHSIYGIDESRLFMVHHSSVQTHIGSCNEELRYKNLFCSIDISRDFFFSYTYRFMWTLQRNVCIGQTEKMPYDDMFVWNSFLTREICQQARSLQWTVALTHGFFQQEKFQSSENMKIVVSLIARRSRHFAGTRYLKRGVNDKGRVANDVETEQIVFEEACRDLDQVSSVVQHRGSIPLYWSQETSILSPRPDIKLHKRDPNFQATKLHFQNLAGRYGHPIIVLNLAKDDEDRPRETILSKEFRDAIAYLNLDLPKDKHINYIGWDFQKYSKRPSTEILRMLGLIAKDVLKKTAFYCCRTEKITKGDSNCDALNYSLMNQESSQHASNSGQQSKDQVRKMMFQYGILRSNCIDCIDRTNVAQYAFGLIALGEQLFSLGLPSHWRDIDPESKLAVQLLVMYEKMGDVLGIQYGGSSAHNKRHGKWKGTLQTQKLLRSIKRHCNNAFIDPGKQDAINIFLGHFRPEVGKLALWQLDSDHHLRFRRVGEDPLNDNRLSFKRSFSAGNMLEQLKPGDFEPGMLERDTQSFLKTFNGLRSTPIVEFKEVANTGASYSAPELLNRSSNQQGIMNIDMNDWLSSSGNSCDGGSPERQCIMKNENNPQCSGSTTTSEEAHYSNGLREAYQETCGSYYSDTNEAEEDCVDVNNSREEEETDRISNGCERIVSLLNQVAQTESVGKMAFANWVNYGQTLCH